MDSRLTRREMLKASGALAIGAGLAGRLAVPACAGEAAPVKRFSKAVVLGMLQGNTNAEKFKLCKQCGFDGVEGYPIGDEPARQAMRADADAAGIRVHSIMNGGWGAPFSDPDENAIAKGLKEMENSLLTAKALGADAVLLVPAVVKGNVTEKQAWETSQKHIRKLLPLAKETGVTICIENVWNNFTYKLDDFVRYIDEFESPLVQAYFDVGNHVIRSDWATPQDWVRKLGKRIRKIHLKDYHIEKKQWAMLLEGSVNWPEVMKALVEVGYVGWLTCELGGGDAKYLGDVSQRVDKIIGSA